MELRDFIVTPFLLVLVYAGAYVVRDWVTDPFTRRYFFPALTLKIFGALAVGFIYQFYYGGGDTFNYHTHGSRHIWEAFIESPSAGLKLMFSHGQFDTETFRYAARIPFYRDPNSFFVVRVASFFDLITFSTYSATAILFAVLSFTGVWLLFSTFYSLYPHLHKWFAVACFFVPSVFFWGSGLLKDTLTLSAVGIAVYCFKRLFLDRKFSLLHLIALVLSFWCIFAVKKYILLCLAPTLLLWLYTERLVVLRSTMARILVFPFIIGILLATGYGAMLKIGEGDRRYSLDKISETAQSTAYDIAYYTGKDAGSRYSLGELDGSFRSMLMLAPSAINVSLFRPYLWEVRNPLMLLSALEGFAFLILFLYVWIKKGVLFYRALFIPPVLFSLTFSLIFAFAVGVSTYNFGTLSRYKIPLLPFFVIALAIIYDFHTQSASPAPDEDK